MEQETTKAIQSRSATAYQKDDCFSSQLILTLKILPSLFQHGKQFTNKAFQNQLLSL